MAPAVAIVGGGLVSPLGVNARSTFDRLLAGAYIEDHARAAGTWDERAPRVISMARSASDEALAEAGWDRTTGDFALVVGTSKGSVERWLAPTGGPDVTGLADVAAALPATGPRLTVSAACASGLVAIARAAMMIRARQARRVLVVASEASVHPLFLGSFARLGVLPKPGVGCRPFDVTRDGFLMSEAAAAVCLEARERHVGSDEPALSEQDVLVENFALGGDASHLTAADPDGRLLRHLIHKVLDHRPVDLVHAHGTGTKLNDPTELAALDATATAAASPAASPPFLYSHKGALGHSLGAAGLVSVVLSRLMHQRSNVPGNVRTVRPLPHQSVTLSPKARHQPVRRSLVTASGFGGAAAALTLARM